MIITQPITAISTDMFTRRLVYQDDRVDVYVVDHAGAKEPVIGSELDKEVPDTKCYRTTAQKPRHLTDIWKSIVPYCMIYVRHTNYFYDFGPQSHLMHDTNFADQNNSIVTALSIRNRHPELQYIFDLDCLRPILDQMPVLGAHFDLDSITQAYQDSLKHFRIEFDHALQTAEFNIETHKFYNDFCVLSDKTTFGGSPGCWYTGLPRILTDDIRINSGILFHSIQSVLTLECLEDQTQRSRVIKDAIEQWLLNSHYYKITKRILKDDHALATVLVKQFLLRVIQNKLNQAIFKVIENAK